MTTHPPIHQDFLLLQPRWSPRNVRELIGQLGARYLVAYDPQLHIGHLWTRAEALKWFETAAEDEPIESSPFLKGSY